MSFTYGAGKYGSHKYGGKTGSPFFIHVPVFIDVYDSLGTYKGCYQAGSTDLLNVNFSHDESGCKDFDIRFGSYKDIEKKDVVKIKLFSSDKYFFTGVVRTVPIKGSTSRDYSYSGFGLSDYFQRINTEDLTYAAKTVYFILDELLDILTAKTQIVRNEDKIDTAALTAVTVSAANLHYVQIADALDALKKIANSDGNDYLVGVDESGEFFFRARSQELKATLIVGKRGKYGIPEYRPSDGYEARTKYYVLRNDGTYYTTLSTSEDNDVFEEKLTAPDIADADIDKWAAGILATEEVNKRSAAVMWPIEKYYPDVIIADGQIRVISNVPPKKWITVVPLPFGSGLFGSGLFGGNKSQWESIDDTLNVVEIQYTISSKERVRNITLGTATPRLENEIVRVNKKLTDLEISLGM